MSLLTAALAAGIGQKARHTCGGPSFGRLTAGCPRCEELAQGAAPRSWNGAARKEQERQFSADLRAHRCADSRCGPVCTFGDW